MKHNHLDGQLQRFTADRRSQLLEAFGKRPGTAAQFAAQRGVGVSTLYQWLKRAGRRVGRVRGNQRRTRSPFHEVCLPEVLRPASSWAGEVQLPDGTQLRWNSQATAAQLQELLVHLRGSC